MPATPFPLCAGDRLLRKDRNAVEGMPLKLVTVAVMMAITVPALFDALGRYQTTSTMAVLKEEVGKIQDAVEELTRRGPGNQRSVDLTMPQDGNGYIIIGGTTMSESMSICYGSCKDDPVRTFFTDPNVVFRCPGGKGLRVEGQMNHLVLRSVGGDGTVVIEATL